MTCQECELWLADGAEEASTADHLRGCAECRALQAELRANAMALSALRDDELPRVKTSVRRPAHAWIAAAAAGILLALILHRSPHPQQVTAPVTRPSKVTAQLVREPRPRPRSSRPCAASASPLAEKSIRSSRCW